MTKQLKADLMLVLVTLFWGVSYLLIDISLTDIDPFTLNSLRFLIAFFVALLIAFPKLKTVNKITLQYSALIGFALLYIGATFGVRYTSLSNAGFMWTNGNHYTGLIFFKKERPEEIRNYYFNVPRRNRVAHLK